MNGAELGVMTQEELNEYIDRIYGRRLIQKIRERLWDIHPYNLSVEDESTEQELVLKSYPCCWSGPQDDSYLRCSTRWFWTMLKPCKTDSDIDDFIWKLDWKKTKGDVAWKKVGF